MSKSDTLFNKTLKLTILALWLLVVTHCSDDEPVDTIFYNGTIITLSDAKEQDSLQPEAILVQSGKISRLGKAAEILRLKTPATQLVDLKGATLMPGFIAPHTHPDLSAYLHTFVDLSGFVHSTPEEVWAHLRRAVKKAKPGEWIYCKGYDPIMIPGLKAPGIHELDQIAPDNPLVIMAQSLHSAWANSLAFKEIGITATTPDPAPGSYYEKDANGKLTGFVAEVAAIKPFSAAALKVIDIKSNMLGVLRDYAKNGITSIATAGLFASDKKPLWLMRWLSAKHPGIFLQSLGFVGLLPRREPTVRNFVYLKVDTPFLIPDQPEREEDNFRIIGIKLWYDGSPYTGSMYLSEPYVDSALMRDGLKIPKGSRGKSVLSRAEFRQQIRKYHDLGWQLAIHSQGDQAAREVVDELEQMLKESPRADHRHRLEHGLLIPAETLYKMDLLGLTASFHVNHLYYYGNAIRDQILGPQRTSEILPLNSA